MKRAMAWISMWVLLAAVARAEWRDLRLGSDHAAVLRCIGVPLLSNRSRGGGTETWTYDRGGYIRFENGRVTFWRPPEKR